MTTDVPLDTDSRRWWTPILPSLTLRWDRCGQGEAINRRRQYSDRTASLRYINFRHRARQPLKKDSRAPYLVPVKAIPPGRPKPADLDGSSTADKTAYFGSGAPMGSLAGDLPEGGSSPAPRPAEADGHLPVSPACSVRGFLSCDGRAASIGMGAAFARNHRSTSSKYALLLPLRSFASPDSHVWTCIPRQSIRPLHRAEGSCVPRTLSYYSGPRGLPPISHRT
jgi:hypothetical protein